MMEKLRRELTIYRHCPEIRSNMRQLYLSKGMGIATIIVFSPLLAISLFTVLVVYVFDHLGQWTVYPAHKLTEWLHEYQRDQIREAHSHLSVETIQKRIGEHDENL